MAGSTSPSSSRPFLPPFPAKLLGGLSVLLARPSCCPPESTGRGAPSPPRTRGALVRVRVSRCGLPRLSFLSAVFAWLAAPLSLPPQPSSVSLSSSSSRPLGVSVSQNPLFRALPSPISTLVPQGTSCELMAYTPRASRGLRGSTLSPRLLSPTRCRAVRKLLTARPASHSPPRAERGSAILPVALTPSFSHTSRPICQLIPLVVPSKYTENPPHLTTTTALPRRAPVISRKGMTAEP